MLLIINMSFIFIISLMSNMYLLRIIQLGYIGQSFKVIVSNLLDKFFGTPNINKLNSSIDKGKLDLTTIETQNSVEVKGNLEQSSNILSLREELEVQFPNWREEFINSPIENSEISITLKQFLIETLTNHL